MNEIFSHPNCNRIPTCCPYQKSKLPHRKTNQGLWNNLNKFLNTSVSLNAFKHNLKDYYLRKGNKKGVKSDRYNKTIPIHGK